jgi:hypothetical protein
MTALRRLPLELLLLPFLVLAGLATRATNVWLEARHVESVANGEVGALPNGHVVNVVSLGFERLVADLFWIRTVYYVGDDVASAANWPAAERLANLVTDTDPRFDSAYVTMGSVLGGLRRDSDASIRLLEKGAAVSSYWRIHFMLGFEYFMEKQDYLGGAKCLERAVELGGPLYLKLLISRLYSNAGDPATAMQFIAIQLKNEESPAVREMLEKRFSDLWINRDLALIDAAIEGYRNANHAAPKSVDALVDAGLLPKLPHDPQGGAYAIEDGRAKCALAYEPLKLNQTWRPNMHLRVKQ